MIKNDLESRADVEYLVRTFYERVIPDPVIGYIFTEIAQLDLPSHLPILVDFWCGVLFQDSSYKGNPMLVHLKLNEQEKLTKEHFNRWLELWETTVLEHFEGPKATIALERARQIALLMMHKLESAK
ncbi:MAG: group III truncated hemoglobin [Saprospiraceae bacterium]